MRIASRLLHAKGPPIQPFGTLFFFLARSFLISMILHSWKLGCRTSWRTHNRHSSCMGGLVCWIYRTSVHQGCTAPSYCIFAHLHNNLVSNLLFFLSFFPSFFLFETATWKHYKIVSFAMIAGCGAVAYSVRHHVHLLCSVCVCARAHVCLWWQVCNNIFCWVSFLLILFLLFTKTMKQQQHCGSLDATGLRMLLKDNSVMLDRAYWSCMYASAVVAWWNQTNKYTLRKIFF